MIYQELYGQIFCVLTPHNLGAGCVFASQLKPPAFRSACVAYRHDKHRNSRPFLLFWSTNSHTEHIWLAYAAAINTMQQERLNGEFACCSRPARGINEKASMIFRIATLRHNYIKPHGGI